MPTFDSAVWAAEQDEQVEQMNLFCCCVSLLHASDASDKQLRRISFIAQTCFRFFNWHLDPKKLRVNIQTKVNNLLTFLIVSN